MQIWPQNQTFKSEAGGKGNKCRRAKFKEEFQKRLKKKQQTQNWCRKKGGQKQKREI
jgi:hypothetical protein